MVFFCVKGTLFCKLLNSFFIILSTFWITFMLGMVAAKLKSAFAPGTTPVWISWVVWLFESVHKKRVGKLLFQGGVTFFVAILPVLQTTSILSPS